MYRETTLYVCVLRTLLKALTATNWLVSCMVDCLYIPLALPVQAGSQLGQIRRRLLFGNIPRGVHPCCFVLVDSDVWDLSSCQHSFLAVAEKFSCLRYCFEVDLRHVAWSQMCVCALIIGLFKGETIKKWPWKE